MLTLVGLSHRSAPLELRERLALPGETIRVALKRLHADPAVSEAYILSTCNRVEFLVRSDSSDGTLAIDRYLDREHGIDASVLKRHAYRLSGREAVRHLFRVASGLDSMILGEPQIHGQVKEAFAVARSVGTTGVVLDRMLQHGLAAAKRARSETGISKHAVSVAYAAVQLALKIFGSLEQRRVLMLGAGKMGELVARHLDRQGIRELIVCSRQFTNAARVAERFGGRAMHWAEGLDQLAQVDIVIGCTGAPRPVLGRERVAAALRGRRSGPLFLIDIAVPRDIEPSVHGLANVYLYDVDALEGVVDSNITERRRAAELAQRLIHEEVDRFLSWRESQGVAPLIVALRESFFARGERELKRFRGRLGPLTEDQEKSLNELTRALVRKFLHAPTRYLRDAADRGEPESVSRLFIELFELELPAAAPDKTEPGKLAGPQRLLRGGRDEG